MKPLVYLFLRTTLNGIKRALTSPRRVLGVIFFFGWYILIFIRPFDRDSRSLERVAGARIQFDLPSSQIMEAATFGGFLFLSVFLMMGILTYRGGFKPADVDVLFPTPVSPKLVLVFRMFRDYFLTLIFPLIFVLFGYRASEVGLAFLFRNFPEHGGLLVRFFPLAWLLMATAFVSIGYAASMFVNRSDLQSDRNAKIIGWGIALAIAGAGTQIALALRADPSLETAVSLAYSPLLRVVFGVGTLATLIVAGPLTDDLSKSALGFVGIVALIVLSFRLAMGQVGWLYDQAAVRGFSTENVKQLQRQGDMFGIHAEMARQGKFKRGRISASLSRWTTRGVRALIWKELVLTTRSGMWQFIVFIPMTVLMVGMSGFASRESSRGGIGFLFLFMVAMSVFMLSMSVSTNGFLELLRRVDLQKPLPFNPSETVLFEVVAKAVPTTLITALGIIVGVIVDPGLWQLGLAALVMAPAMAVALCAAVLVVILLFPDMDDATQRNLRGLLMMLGVVIFAAPGVLAYIGAQFIAPPFVAGLLAALIHIAVALGGSWASGMLYASFNPNE